MANDGIREFELVVLMSGKLWLEDEPERLIGSALPMLLKLVAVYCDQICVTKPII